MVTTPKSINLQRIKENLEGTHVCLDEEDMKKLMSLDKGVDKQYRLLKMEFLYKKGQTYEQFWTIQEDKDFKLP